MDHILLTEFKEARSSCGWSQASLAAKLEVKPQKIKRLEAGVGSVPMMVEAMAALDFQLIGIGPGRTLGDQLRGRRQKKGHSLETVAKRTGLSRATIASLECGRGSVRSLLRLLTTIAPKARRRAPERAYRGAGDKFDRDSRFTPPETGPVFLTNHLITETLLASGRILHQRKPAELRRFRRSASNVSG